MRPPPKSENRNLTLFRVSQTNRTRPFLSADFLAVLRERTARASAAPRRGKRSTRVAPASSRCAGRDRFLRRRDPSTVDRQWQEGVGSGRAGPLQALEKCEKSRHGTEQAGPEGLASISSQMPGPECLQAHEAAARLDPVTSHKPAHPRGTRLRRAPRRQAILFSGALATSHDHRRCQPIDPSATRVFDSHAPSTAGGPAGLVEDAFEDLGHD